MTTHVEKKAQEIAKEVVAHLDKLMQPYYKRLERIEAEAAATKWREQPAPPLEKFHESYRGDTIEWS
jgi:hypothetical protein